MGFFLQKYLGTSAALLYWRHIANLQKRLFLQTTKIRNCIRDETLPFHSRLYPTDLSKSYSTGLITC